jgi:hypothetical protein
MLTSGVGQYENPVTSMRRTKDGSRYAVPFCVIPERGQGSENIAHPPNKESCDVLHECIAGSKLANDSGELKPESASFAG